MMSIPTVARPVSQRHPAPARVTAVALLPPKALVALGPEMDRLLKLRTLLRRAETEDRRLTQEVLSAPAAAGADRLEGEHAVARLESRTTLRPDGGLILEAVGRRGYEELSVGAARRLTASNNLVAISKATRSTALRVEPRAPTAA